MKTEPEKKNSTMSDRPYLSIIVLCYNVEKYIGQCLESIRNQTFKDFEVIIVDDGSTDNSGEICDSYAKEDARFKVIHKKNGGIIAARKTGIGAARGLWCGSVDGDDWIEPDMYEKLICAQTENNSDYVQCGEIIEYKNSVKDDYDRKTFFYNEQLFADAVYNQSRGAKPVLEVSLCRVILRTEKLKNIVMKLDDRCSLCEDAVCVYLYAATSKTMANIGEPLYHYRRRQGSCTKSKKGRDVSGLYKLFDIAEEGLKGNPNETSYLRCLALYFIRHCNASFMFNLKLLKAEERESYMEKEISSDGFQKLISYFDIGEYYRLFTKSTAESIIFRKVPSKWVRELEEVSDSDCFD